MAQNSTQPTAKLLKVGSQEYRDIPGHDGTMLTIRVSVTDNNMKDYYDKYVTTSDRTNKASQKHLHNSIHKMIDEAMMVMFDDSAKELGNV